MYPEIQPRTQKYRNTKYTTIQIFYVTLWEIFDHEQGNLNKAQHVAENVNFVLDRQKHFFNKGQSFQQELKFGPSTTMYLLGGKYG